MMRSTVSLILAGIFLAGCAATKQEESAEFTAAFNVASAAEAVYAASPGAKPQNVAEASRLLAAAQAALLTWSNSTSPADQTAANAAVAALVAYMASVSASAAPSSH